ncbi:hypothetical protein AB0O07_30295 [Streptomyces sp. NPDC093085]|uniref:hypothetical protein n=1 Tax=Streptomyces sp. NPDC093085 TaxID=3155068 RepID=UPI0034257715
MRQSITARRAPDWMDIEREYEARRNPDTVRVEPNPAARLAALRSDNLRQVVAQVRARGRTPRVCRYALSVGGHRPANSLAAVTAFAERRAWHVGEEQTFIDHQSTAAPQSRPGWCLVRRQIRAGYADGVVVTTTGVISPHLGPYEEELRWFELHRAFIAVVAPTARTGRL